MKSLTVLLVLFLRISTLFADDNSTISKVFIHQSGKNNLYVLQLKDDGGYDYMRYTDKRTYHDFGLFTIRYGKISFESHNRKHGFNSVGGKTFVMNKKGLYKTRWDALFGKKSKMNVSTDPSYMNDWSYNPIVGKSLEDVAAEKAKATANKNVKSKEVRLADMAAFTKQFYLNEAGVYANPYEAMLEKNYCGPESCATTVDGKIVPYAGDTNSNVLLADYTTVIHESTHTANSN